MELKDLVGPHKLECAARPDANHPFGRDCEGIAWAMDNKVYMVFEASNDGYRSSAGPILVADGPAYDFWDPEYLHRDIVGRHVTKGDYSGEADILELIDVATGHVWLRVGTDNVDDYYPSFVAVWTPMPPDSSKAA